MSVLNQKRGRYWEIHPRHPIEIRRDEFLNFPNTSLDLVGQAYISTSMTFPRADTDSAKKCPVLKVHSAYREKKYWEWDFQYYEPLPIVLPLPICQQWTSQVTVLSRKTRRMFWTGQVGEEDVNSKAVWRQGKKTRINNDDHAMIRMR